MIQQNINRIKEELGETTLIAVSKFRSLAELEALYGTGQRIFAENRVQELLSKQSELPSDIEWHLIGHLQTNKVKQIIEHVALIHSVDSLKVLKEIQKQSNKKDITTNVLLQVHVAEEDSKYGFKPEELTHIAETGGLSDYPNVEFKGIMSMATLTQDAAQIENEFARTVKTFNQIKAHVPNHESFTEISMGMSGDYLIAKKMGATMVRIGSKIFE
tara:strand:+ start:600 stop:1247 length:648 start_codon:yes stop_codon:yes gene_type:complete